MELMRKNRPISWLSNTQRKFLYRTLAVVFGMVGLWVAISGPSYSRTGPNYEVWLLILLISSILFSFLWKKSNSSY